MSYPDAALDLLTATHVGLLSTHAPDGKIQTTAIWYLLDDDGQLKISLNDARKKVRNLQADPTATVFILDPTNAFHFVEVRGTATIEVDTDFTLRNKVSLKYGSELANFDEPGQTRYAATLVPTRVNAQ
ncbi:MAG: putative F420-dependent enzyme [Ilumatobacteraceae bacterium]|nr:putative F420-dependent enzyme [Ilumatobacteraceae bacterium]